MRYSKAAGGFELIEIPSLYKTLPYKENNSIYLHNSQCDDNIGNILFIHGLYDEHLLNYTFLIKMLNELKFNVYIMELPYHHKRKPKTVSLAGNIFKCRCVQNKKAFIQSIYDVEACMQFINYVDKNLYCL